MTVEMTPSHIELGHGPSSLAEKKGPSVSEMPLPTPSSGVLEDPMERQQPEFSLPPADKGKHAWLFLLACFVLEGLVWGFPFAFGVFQDYYRTNEPFSKYTNTASIGTCALGLMYLTFPFVTIVQRMYPRMCRWAPTFGILLTCVSLILCSFSKSLTHLMLTQGVLYGIAGSICYCPCMLYVEEWFVQRRGLAFGIMWSGTGIGGFLIPLMLDALLRNYGFALALQIWAATFFALTMPLVYFIKPRLPASEAPPLKSYNFGFIFDRTFVLYQTASIVESLGFFLPAIYLPTYARSVLGAGSFMSALTIIIINITSAVGMVIVGMLTDRWHVTTCIMITTVGAVVGVFLVWGFASNLALLYVFCAIYGFFASSYVSTWPGVMRQVVSFPSGKDSEGKVPKYDPGMILGLLTAGRGVANIISGPLSELLLKSSPETGPGIAGEYMVIIAFTGATAVLGGVPFLFKKLGWTP